MQPEAGAAEIATRREEGIEGLTPDAGIHPAAIVGEKNLHLVRAERPHLDVDGTALAVWKRMHHGIQEEVRKHLPVGSGIAVHRQIGLALDVDRQVVPSQSWAQAHENLL